MSATGESKFVASIAGAQATYERSASAYKLPLGLFWPIGVALMTFVVGSMFLKETHNTRIWDEIDALDAEAAAAGGGQPRPAPAV